MKLRNLIRATLLVLLCSCRHYSLVEAPDIPESEPYWIVRQRDNRLELFHGSGNHFPQYAAIHLSDAYLRMNYGISSSWGTSVLLLPSFWSNATLYQGAPVSVSWNREGKKLVIQFEGEVASLQVYGSILFDPPGDDRFSAQVDIRQVTGQIQLDDRPNEAFKPVMLSSMHINDQYWDTDYLSIQGDCYDYPGSGWIIYPHVVSDGFCLQGGSSAWEENKPSVQIKLDRDYPLTGWQTPSTDPNDDNIGVWAASDTLLRRWNYQITVTP